MISVAIDGPVGAGKSTVARESAKRLGFIYADTGALYRAIGLYVCRKGIDDNTAEDYNQRVTALLPEITVEIRLENDIQKVFLCGEDVSEEIRQPKISMAASAVSAIPEVRDFLLELQRRIARENNVLMDGRDIGTVVLPSADVKIFITANPEIRARRRFEELVNKGVETDFNQVLADLNRRDYQDSHRAVAPLKMAEDAILLDTTRLDFEESVQSVVNLVRAVIG